MTDTDPQLEADGNQDDTEAALAFYAAAKEALPANFKSPDALIESYKSSQAEMNRAVQREKELQQQVQHYETLVAQQQTQVQPQYDPTADPLVVGYEQAMEAGDYRTALAYQAQISQAVAQQAVQSALPQVQKQYETTAEAQAALVADHAWNNLRARYGDDLEVNRDKIHAFLQENDWMIPDAAMRDPRATEMVYENVYKIVNPGAFVQGQSVDMTAAKMAAQSLPGAAGRPPSPDAAKAEWETIKNAAKNDPGRYW